MKEIKLFFSDVDGTYTDGKMFYDTRGVIDLMQFNSKDSYGIYKLKQKGIYVCLISGTPHRECLEKRSEEIGVDLLVEDCKDKLITIKKVISDCNVCIDEVAYIGDDDNDYEAMKYIDENGGLISCPVDASRKILDLVTKSENSYDENFRYGGEGAVRDFIEYIFGGWVK